MVRVDTVAERDLADGVVAGTCESACRDHHRRRLGGFHGRRSARGYRPAHVGGVALTSGILTREFFAVADHAARVAVAAGRLRWRADAAPPGTSVIAEITRMGDLVRRHGGR
jgi:hypothetical protein